MRELPRGIYGEKQGKYEFAGEDKLVFFPVFLCLGYTLTKNPTLTSGVSCLKLFIFS